MSQAFWLTKKTLAEESTMLSSTGLTAQTGVRLIVPILSLLFYSKCLRISKLEHSVFLLPHDSHNWSPGHHKSQWSSGWDVSINTEVISPKGICQKPNYLIADMQGQLFIYTTRITKSTLFPLSYTISLPVFVYLIISLVVLEKDFCSYKQFSSITSCVRKFTIKKKKKSYNVICHFLSKLCLRTDPGATWAWPQFLPPRLLLPSLWPVLSLFAPLHWSYSLCLTISQPSASSPNLWPSICSWLSCRLELSYYSKTSLNFSRRQPL